MTGVRLFAGANTAQGFYSFYPLARDDLQRVFISRVDRDRQVYFYGRDCQELSPGPVDRFHCSADSKSLTPSTSLSGSDCNRRHPPHVLNRPPPGAVQEIVDLGQCFSSQGLSRRRKKS